MGAALVAAAALCGCGQQSLEGSLTAVLNLDYDLVYLERSDVDFAIRFAKKQGTGENTPLKVTVALLEGELDPPKLEWDLAERMPNGAQRGIISRNVLDEAPVTFPDILRGKLKLSSAPTERGQSTAAELNFTFVNGIQPANGRTVFGNFTAKVP